MIKKNRHWIYLFLVLISAAFVIITKEKTEIKELPQIYKPNNEHLETAILLNQMEQIMMGIQLYINESEGTSEAPVSLAELVEKNILKSIPVYNNFSWSDLNEFSQGFYHLKGSKISERVCSDLNNNKNAYIGCEYNTLTPYLYVGELF